MTDKRPVSTLMVAWTVAVAGFWASMWLAESPPVIMWVGVAVGSLMIGLVPLGLLWFLLHNRQEQAHPSNPAVDSWGPGPGQGSGPN